MKQLTPLIITAFVMCLHANAQNGADIYSLQKGDSMVFKLLMPPAYDPAMMKLKPRERLEAMKKQDEDMKKGTANYRVARSCIVIRDRQATATGFTANALVTLTNPATYEVPMVYQCKNDTLYTQPANPFTETPGVGVTFTAAIPYPLKMKVGDLLPDYTNITIGYKVSGSEKMMLPYISKTITTDYVNLQGQTLYSSMQNVWSAKEVTNNFSSITTSEVTFANREVTGDTTISWKGKMYKGFVIHYGMLLKLASDVKADYYEKSMQRITKRLQDKAARQLKDDESGTLTFYYMEVFVPQLGVVGSSITKKDGAFFSKAQLTEE